MKVQNPGFFILELLIAMALMSIFWLVIAQYQASAIKISYDSQKRMQALNIANSLLDKVIQEKKLPKMPQQKIENFTVFWDVTAHTLMPFDTVYLDDNKIQFYFLTVHVAWHHNNNEQTVQLTSGMALNKDTL